MTGENLEIAQGTDDEAAEVTDRLVRYNIELAGEPNSSPVNLSLKDAAGALRGGLVAATSKNVLAIEVIYLDAECRGEGHGQRLLAEAERRGKELGCDLALLDTFSFQAEGFYARQGYKAVGRVDNCPTGEQRITMAKPL